MEQPYTLPVASPSRLGGVKPIRKTDEMAQPVGVDENGRLYVNADTGLNIEKMTLEATKSTDKVTLTLGDGLNSKTVDIPMVVDNSLDEASTNPVRNMIVAQEIKTIQQDIADIKQNGVGGEAGVVIRLTNQNGTSSLISSYGSACSLMFVFTSTEDDLPTGDGTCKISVGGVVRATMSIPQGLNAIDVSPYLAIGENSVIVNVTDVFGKTRSLSYTVTQVRLTIESSFDATVPYYEDIIFKYIPYGSIEKTIHFIIDGNETGTVKTSLSGKQMTRTISYLPHGSHKLEVYSTATMGETTLTSPKLVYDIICLDEDNATPIIASAFPVEQLNQGEQVSIPYIVYDPTKLACDITLEVFTLESGSEVMYATQEITVDRSQHYWNTRRYPIGEVYFRIKYVDITKTHVITVEESKIKVEAETNDLELHLSSDGRSNNETNPSAWTYGDYSTSFTGMNWSSVGWLPDENGDTCLRLNGDARAEIQFQPFKDDLRTYGKTIEIEFVVRDVNNRDTTVISCMSGGLGFEVKPDTAYLVSEQSRVFCNYKDDDNEEDKKIERVRVAFVIEAKNENRLLSIYLNGVLSDVVQYPENDNFQQKEPVNITIGSSDCGIDVYNVRSYSTALTAPSIVTNYLADLVDVALKNEAYEDNDIYDAYGNVSFVKAKEKNSVMVIVGNLPQSKGDKKKVRVYYYDVEDSTLNFDHPVVDIDVQGTSSQWYVRKNWKLKFATDVVIALDQLSGKVICIKVDYAEATGTHNTQNAVFVERLYKEKIPPQEVEPKVRTTIYGKPILLFHQKDDASDPVFYGKANFNFDKGAENVFGFTSQYDTECWEFKNNTSDACNFLGEIPDDWSEDFEARYPDKYTNISRFKEMHDWVVSTKDNIQKFKDEFENYFNLHYCLVYYTYTFFALMVDQRAKNMFLTYWNGKWYPYFYDNDTCFGINNEGELTFDYYHEDIDVVGNKNVYNGQNSTLWKNFRVVYADKIQETWQQWRSDGVITEDLMEEQFITKGSNKWSESVFNEDGIFKYVSMLITDNDASNLPFARGNGELHFKYFIRNRIKYCDSKFYAPDYANDYISLRIYTPVDADGNPITDLVVPANADITVTPFSNMYAGVRYKANGTLQQERAVHGVEVTFEAPDEVFNDTETAIYGASQLSSIGDLAPLYPGTVNVANANKLIIIKVGDGTEGYVNNNLKELSLGTNKLLKTVDIQNCSSYKSALGLAGCPNIEEIYARGSGITGVELANSGYLKIVQLPATIANLTFRNQLYISQFTMEGYDALKTVHVENCPAINTLAIIENAPNLERVRVTNVDWEYDDASFLLKLSDRNLAGIDENGANTSHMWIDGKCHIKSLTGAEMTRIKTLYPYLTITYDSLASNLIFMSEDGETELCRQTVNNGGNGTDPIAVGTISTPIKESTAQYDFAFSGWSLTSGGNADPDALLKVEGDRYVYASFTSSIRHYTVNFYIEGELKESYSTPYMGTATFAGSTAHPTDPDIFEFVEWKPSPANITGDTNCYAQYYDTREITDDWDTIAANVENGTATSLYQIGAYKPVEITYEDGTSETITMEVIAHNHDELADGLKTYEKIGFLPEASIGHINIEYKNKLHMIKSNKHLTWDGTDWETDVSTLPYNLSGTVAVVYNDELHIFGGSTTDCQTKHYKYNGSAWTEVSVLPFNMQGSGSVVVYNNEIHILGSNSTNHYKWDGNEWTNVSKLPGGFMNVNAACVYNGEIYITDSTYGVIAGNMYKWNGTEWTHVLDISSIGGNKKPLILNGELYIVSASTDAAANYRGLYKFTGTSFEKVGDCDYTPTQVCVFRGSFYSVGGTYGQNMFGKWSNPKATLTFMAKNLLKDNRILDNTMKVSCYKDSSLRTYLNNDFQASLPTDLQNVIKEVNKYYGEGTTNTIHSGVEKCWIPSDNELNTQFTNYSLQGEGEAYPVFTDNSSRMRCKTNGDYVMWWTSSTSINTGAGLFRTVSVNGKLEAGANGHKYANNTNVAVCIGFCI